PNDLTPVVIQVENVHGIQNATGALLTFNFVETNAGTTEQWTLNGNPPHTFTVTDGFNGETVALPVPLSEIVEGTNTISLFLVDPTAWPGGYANIDLILVGAGGVPTCINPSQCP